MREGGYCGYGKTQTHETQRGAIARASPDTYCAFVDQEQTAWVREESPAGGGIKNVITRAGQIRAMLCASHTAICPSVPSQAALCLGGRTAS